MKKLMVSTVALLLTAATLSAQTIHHEKEVMKEEKREDRKELRRLEGLEVSNESKESFYRDFGNMPDVSWKRSSYFDEVTFLDQKKEMTAYYDAEWKLVGTTSPATFAELPAHSQKYISAKYPHFSIENVLFFHDNENNDTDMLLYETQFDDADNYFVEIRNGYERILLRVNEAGDVSFFKKLS